MLTRACLVLTQRAAAVLGVVSMPSSLRLSCNSSVSHSQLINLRRHILPSCTSLSRRTAFRHSAPAVCRSGLRCFAVASASVATYPKQEAAQNFTHSLSEEQAAAALAGDGHLRYPLKPCPVKTCTSKLTIDCWLPPSPVDFEFLRLTVHHRIIAGPGSGKTRVLTTRVEYLIKEKGCKPNEMVVITFSNKAARELQDRLDGLLGPELAKRVIAGQKA